MTNLPPIATGLRTPLVVRFVPNFSREPPFLQRGLSYIRGLPHWDVPIVPRSELAALIAGGGQLIQKS